MKKGAYQFKDVELVFKFNKIPACDQEYLRTMFYQTVGDRSVKHTGISFKDFYPDASEFILFDDEGSLYEHMSEYANPYRYTTSHLLHGKKYFLAWTYDQDKANALVTI